MELRVVETIKAVDGSLWGCLEDGHTVAPCEVCGHRDCWRWVCLEGRWSGAIVVACCYLCASMAIHAFVTGEVIMEVC